MAHKKSNHRNRFHSKGREAEAAEVLQERAPGSQVTVNALNVRTTAVAVMEIIPADMQAVRVPGAVRKHLRRAAHLILTGTHSSTACYYCLSQIKTPRHKEGNLSEVTPTVSCRTGTQI